MDVEAGDGGEDGLLGHEQGGVRRRGERAQRVGALRRAQHRAQPQPLREGPAHHQLALGEEEAAGRFGGSPPHDVGEPDVVGDAWVVGLGDADDPGRRGGWDQPGSPSRSRIDGRNSSKFSRATPRSKSE